MHISCVKRKPPKWRDPQFPDLSLDHTVSFQFWNQMQEARGLPDINFNGMQPFKGRPKLRLSFWDKKQKRERSVEIWADVVMSPANWNDLHPMFRRLVPHRLLPPAILGMNLLAPNPTPPTDAALLGDEASARNPDARPIAQTD